MLQIGVDEAGYGPLLGPIVIGAIAVRTPGDAGSDAPLDLRRQLGDLICTVQDAPAGRPPPALPVPIDDSKLIRARFGLQGLARGVGALAAALDQAPPADLCDLLLRYSDRSAAEFARAPWFEDLRGSPVPRYPWSGPLDDAFRSRSVQALDLRVLPVDAPEWNDDLERLGNKARLLGLYSATLLLSILDRHPGEDAQVLMDRHGGRKDYRAYLQGVFPYFEVRTLPALDPDTFRYEVLAPDRRLEFFFLTGGDRRALAVGWASMAAKLTRELFMQRLNAWFAERRPDIRPTAGYVQDGRRFLDDVAPLLKAAGISRDLVVRTR